MERKSTRNLRQQLTNQPKRQFPQLPTFKQFNGPFSISQIHQSIIQTSPVGDSAFVHGSRDGSLESADHVLRTCLSKFEDVVALHVAQNGAAKHSRKQLLSQSLNVTKMTQIKKQELMETDIDPEQKKCEIDEFEEFEGLKNKPLVEEQDEEARPVEPRTCKKESFQQNERRVQRKFVPSAQNQRLKLYLSNNLTKNKSYSKQSSQEKPRKKLQFKKDSIMIQSSQDSNSLSDNEDRQLSDSSSPKTKKKAKRAGTTMFNKQTTVKKPFYEPVNLKQVYPKLKDLKLYDCGKVQQPLHEDVIEQIKFQKVKMFRREQALRKNRKNLKQMDEQLAQKFDKDSDEEQEQVVGQPEVNNDVILDNSKVLYGNDGKVIELARDILMANEVKRARNMNFPNLMLETDSYEGKEVSTVRVPQSQLKVVKRKKQNSDDSSSNLSVDSYCASPPLLKPPFKQKQEKVNFNTLRFSPKNVLDWMKHDPRFNANIKKEENDDILCNQIYKVNPVTQNIILRYQQKNGKIISLKGQHKDNRNMTLDQYQSMKPQRKVEFDSSKYEDTTFEQGSIQDITKTAESFIQPSSQRDSINISRAQEIKALLTDFDFDPKNEQIVPESRNIIMRPKINTTTQDRDRRILKVFSAPNSPRNNIQQISSFSNHVRNQELKKQQKIILQNDSFKMNQNIQNILSRGGLRNKNHIKNMLQNKDEREMKLYTSSQIHRKKLEVHLSSEFTRDTQETFRKVGFWTNAHNSPQGSIDGSTQGSKRVRNMRRNLNI